MRRLVWVLVLGLTFLAVDAGRGRAEGAPVEANKALVRALFVAFEDGDLDAINRIFAPDLLFHRSSGPNLHRTELPSELKGACPMCASLAARRITIDVMLAEGDLVAVRSTWSGSFTGVVRGTQVTGKPITVSFANIYRVEGGRIRENWANTDGLGLAEQLGMKLAPAGKLE